MKNYNRKYYILREYIGNQTFSDLFAFEATLKKFLSEGFPIDWTPTEPPEELNGETNIRYGSIYVSPYTMSQTLLSAAISEYNDYDTRPEHSNKCRDSEIFLLLENGSDVNKTDRDGDNVLMCACQNFEYVSDRVLEAILEKTDINAVNNAGETALDVFANMFLRHYVYELEDHKDYHNDIDYLNYKLDLFSSFAKRLLIAGIKLDETKFKGKLEQFEEDFRTYFYSHYGLNISKMIWERIGKEQYLKMTQDENDGALEQYER